MSVLAIDSTGAYCSCALVKQNGKSFKQSAKINRGHAEYLAPQIQILLNEAQATIAQISLITVCTGPGSFTGLRAGMAMAKGLALAHNHPVIGLSALQIWSAMGDTDIHTTMLSIANVRRKEYFWQIFDQAGPIGVPRLGSLEIAAKSYKKTMGLCGTGAQDLYEYIHENPDPRATFAAHDGYVDPTILAERARQIARQGQSHLYPARPLYHRPADAKLPGGRALSAK